MVINMKKLRAILSMILALALLCGCSGAPASRDPGADTDLNTPAPDAQRDEGLVVVEDLVGRQVVQDHIPQRVAAAGGPTYEMMFMLGANDRVIMVKSGHTTNYPLALLTNPDLANYIGVQANPSSAVNIEDYLKNDIDLVLYYDNEA